MLIKRIANKILQIIGYQKLRPFYKILNINQTSDDLLFKSEIVIYFFGGVGQSYQINQWIDTFSELNKKHKVIVVVRDYLVYKMWKKALPFHTNFTSSFQDTLDFYNKISPKVIIYVNNGFKNIESLSYNNAMHIHINHGESDKSSDHSNQVRSYDFIFVHGPNGYNNYLKYLIKLPSEQLIQTGRPQLDFIHPIQLNTYGRKVIMYAPTWEATHQSMRYTSVDIYGEQIVDTLLGEDQYYLIYKPHPNLGAHDKQILKIHNRIMKKIKKSNFAITITDRDVNDIYPIVDYAIFDMSSIMTDYLNIDKPFILADVFNTSIHKATDYGVLSACSRLTQSNINNLKSIIKSELENDTMKSKRKDVKQLYLGDYKKGESIDKFIDSVSKIINTRDREMEYKDKKYDAT